MEELSILNRDSIKWDVAILICRTMVKTLNKAEMIQFYWRFNPFRISFLTEIGALFLFEFHAKSKQVICY